MDKGLVEHFNEPAMNLCLYGFLSNICVIGGFHDVIDVILSHSLLLSFSRLFLKLHLLLTPETLQ